VTILLSSKDVVMSIVYRIEMMWSLFARYRHWRDCVVVIVDPINMLARVR
jgi:hypothetical protein